MKRTITVEVSDQEYQICSWMYVEKECLQRNIKICRFAFFKRSEAKKTHNRQEHLIGEIKHVKRTKKIRKASSFENKECNATGGRTRAQNKGNVNPETILL